MPDRRVQILMLYVTRNDHLPTPLRRWHTTAGFNHDAVARETCPDCFGETPGRIGCETCRGRGYSEVRRQRDPYSVDRVQPYGIDGNRHAVARERDAAIDRLDAQLATPYATPADEIADANARPFAWERLRKDMYKRYDYRALDIALERMHTDHPGVAPLTREGLALLDAWLPDPLRAPPLPKPSVNVAAKGRHADPKARSQRDDQVRDMLASGASWDEVAHVVGLSAKQLRRIASRRDEEAA